MDDFVTEVKLYINDETKLGQTGLARITGLSGAVISQFLKGTYGGDLDRTRKRITAAIELHRERRIHERPETYAPTDQGRTVEKAILYALKHKQSAAVIADSGLGKSTAARHVVAREEFGLVYVQCDAQDCSPIAFLDRVSQALGMQTEQRRYAWRLQRAVTERFRDTEWVLIIDDAHYLIDPRHTSHSRSLDIVKDLEAHAGTPFVLLGVPELWDVIQRRVGGGWYAQLRRRIGIVQHLTVQAVQADDVEAVVKSLDARCSDSVLKVLTALAREPGGYGNVEKAVRWATRDGGKQVTTDSLKHFLAATSNVRVRIGRDEPVLTKDEAVAVA
jgi:DNA transposition AAA+ family ATPase